ncbi:MAG: hypothetical protein ACK56F_17155, partial [bacterium]
TTVPRMDGARPERLTGLVWLVRVMVLALNGEGELPERTSHRSWLPPIFGRMELLPSNKPTSSLLVSQYSAALTDRRRNTKYTNQ